MSLYNNIGNIPVDSKFPWLEEQGVHIVTIDEWYSKRTRLHGEADFANVTVHKTISGDASAVGLPRCRMRTFNSRKEGANDLAFGEVRQRAQVALSVAARAANGDPSYVVPLAQVDGNALAAIVADNGAMVAGFPVKATVLTVKTKTGSPFTTVQWSIPTKGDLEGLRLDEQGRIA